MAGRIRVLDSANRTMQRLGYLKPLCALVNETETSNLSTLGKRFIERVTKRVRIAPPFDPETRDYVKCRLTDGAYRELRKAVLEGANGAPVHLEIQDVYLADASLPSRTGKLVEANWRRYPYLGTSLDLIKKGTYSALTRSLVLLAVTHQEELAAFTELNKKHNPLRISDRQALVLLYCLVDNDAEVVQPFFQGLISLPGPSLDERGAGELLPGIFRAIVKANRARSVTAEERDRLVSLDKSAASVEKAAGKSYLGGGAREDMVRARLEPYCDLGLLTKPDRDRFEYRLAERLRAWLGRWEQAGSTRMNVAATSRWPIWAESRPTIAPRSMRRLMRPRGPCACKGFWPQTSCRASTNCATSRRVGSSTRCWTVPRPDRKFFSAAPRTTAPRNCCKTWRSCSEAFCARPSKPFPRPTFAFVWKRNRATPSCCPRL
ncbi:MAG TPA: hypothetical protein VMV69_14945 [Pirellulales bacterium]|nr:hypothetical protein [Pirellulales bacterium]